MRLGQLSLSDLSPEERERITSISNVTFVDARLPTGFVGHSYFHTNPAVSSDLILLLRDDRPPGAEHGRPLQQEMGNYWVIYSGYPRSEGGNGG